MLRCATCNLPHSFPVLQPAYTLYERREGVAAHTDTQACRHPTRHIQRLGFYASRSRDSDNVLYYYHSVLPRKFLTVVAAAVGTRRLRWLHV